MTCLALLVSGAQGDALEAAFARFEGTGPRRRISAAEISSSSCEEFSGVLVAVEEDVQGLPNLKVAQEHFLALAESSCPQVVVLSSTAVHEPSHHHHDRVEEKPLRPLKQKESSRAERWRALEELAKETFAESKTCLTLLRSAPLASLDHELLAGRMTCTVPGFDPVVQFLALDDLVQGVMLVLEQRAAGVFHVVPEEPVFLSRALRLAGVRRLPVPASLQTLTKGAARAEALARRRYPNTASGSRLQALGFKPRFTSAQAVWQAAGTPRELRSLAHRSVDPYGQDREYIDRLGGSLFSFLHDRYWRVEERGLEQVPKEGRGVLVGVHRGFMPWDGVMVLHALAQAYGRYPRFLIHPSLVKFPFLAPYMRRLGGLLACQQNAAWVLENEGLLGIFPEGIRGAFRSYRKAYELGRFGRDEFVKIALRHRAPIVPFVTVGSAETFPILKKLRWRWWQRYSEWPCFPITPTLGLVPLPSKWHTLFLAPIPVQERYGPEAAEDRDVVRALSQEVRSAMEEALTDLLARRPAIFHGSIFRQDVAPKAPKGVLV